MAVVIICSGLYFFSNASRLNVDKQMIKNVNAQQTQCIFLTLSIWNCVDELTSHVLRLCLHEWIVNFLRSSSKWNDWMNNLKMYFFLHKYIIALRSGKWYFIEKGRRHDDEPLAAQFFSFECMASVSSKIIIATTSTESRIFGHTGSSTHNDKTWIATTNVNASRTTQKNKTKNS